MTLFLNNYWSETRNPKYTVRSSAQDLIFSVYQQQIVIEF